MESSKGSSENSESNKSTDWSMIFAQMIKQYGFDIKQILELSYPQFKALYSIAFDPKTFNVVVPYMGSGEVDKTAEIKQEGNEVTSKEGVLQMIAMANASWK